MQIHELTKKKTAQLEEGVASGLGGAAGATVSGIKDIGSVIASPFKDIASGYQTGRADQRTSALADKFQRAWQQYAIQWAKSQGGQYTAPGRAAPAQQATGGQQAGQAPGTQKGAKQKAPGVDQQALYATIQALDNKALNAVAKILSQKVGPAATMNALKAPPVSEAQLNELGWNDIKAGAQRFGQDITRGATQLGQAAKSAYKAAAPVVKKAAKTGVSALKAAPGAVATAAGGTAGAIAGMPARASTAYRASKATTSGPKMTMQELQLALTKLTTTQATKLFAFVQQIQAARKAGLTEGISPDTLLPSYEQALKAFVQKNMLAGMQYSRLQNAGQIDDLINKLADPANDSDSAQKDLWNKLTLAASVAQHTPAGGGQPQAGGQSAAGTAPTATQATSDQDDPEALKQPVMQAISQITKEGTLKAIGQTLSRGFTNNNRSIKSTGEPAVDALLMSMGFNPQ
jgi:hypothetical protein